MDESYKKVDRRVRKTKKAIRNAFAELLAQKDISEITIKDISDTADINRKTFYNYYSGVHQVVDEIENEIVETLNDVLGEINIKQDMKNPYHIFEKLTAVINADLDFYSHLMKVSSNSSLMPKISAALMEKMKYSISAQIAVDGVTLDIATEYVLSGMMAVYRNWFNSNRENSIEELSKTVSLLTSSGINGLLDRVAEG